MYLDSSIIGNGIYELSGFYQSNIKANYKKTMSELPKDATIVIASLTTRQVKGIKLLKKHGFKQSGRAKTNPNSGNKILLFVKKIKKSK